MEAWKVRKRIVKFCEDNEITCNMLADACSVKYQAARGYLYGNKSSAELLEKIGVKFPEMLIYGFDLQAKAKKTSKEDKGVYLMFKNFKSKLKGWIGEKAVSLAGWVRLPSKKYKKFNNIIIPSEKGTSQIDHLIISKYGIFIVETKFMHGWIFGGSHQKYWTQTFYRKKFKFQNPLRQNYAHIKALEYVLKTVEQDNIHSVIAMCGDHQIKTEMPDNVVRCLKYVDYVLKHKKEVFTNEQVASFTNEIKRVALPASKGSNKLHAYYLDRRHNSDEDAEK